MTNIRVVVFDFNTPRLFNLSFPFLLSSSASYNDILIFIFLFVIFLFFIICPSFFTLNPSTIILFLPVIIGGVASISIILFFVVIVIVSTITFFFFSSPVYFSSLLSHIINLHLRYHLPLLFPIFLRTLLCRRRHHYHRDVSLILVVEC